MVTSATFSPSGDQVVAGLYDGQCIFFQKEVNIFFSTKNKINKTNAPRWEKKHSYNGTPPTLVWRFLFSIKGFFFLNIKRRYSNEVFFFIYYYYFYGLYLAQGLKYITQIDCRNRRGKFAAGRKVTGLHFHPTEHQVIKKKYLSCWLCGSF